MWLRRAVRRHRNALLLAAAALTALNAARVALRGAAGAGTLPPPPLAAASPPPAPADPGPDAADEPDVLGGGDLSFADDEPAAAPTAGEAPAGARDAPPALSGFAEELGEVEAEVARAEGAERPTTRPPPRARRAAPPPPRREAPTAAAGASSDAGADAAELSAQHRELWRRLRTQRQVLTRRRERQHGMIPCGGTGAVQFRTWDKFMHPQPGESLAAAIPDADPDLFAVCGELERCGRRDGCNLTLDGIAERAAAAAGPAAERPTCAVVGNGGRLRYEVHGKEIDALDVVIRFNQGRTKGFEKQVGTRSSIRMYNGPYVEPKQAGEVTIAQLRDPAVRTWVKAYERQRDKLGNDPFAFVMDPELICHAWDWVDKQGDKPSSGLVGVFFALSFCREVHVFGFQFDAYFNASMRPHYYDWERPKPGREKAHPFEAELDVYNALAAAGRLTLH